MKKLPFILTLILIFTLMCGCENGKDADVTDAPVTGGTAELNEPTPYPLIIGGVEIAASPKTVVSLSPSLSEIIFEMGYGSRIIGRGSHCDYPPSVLGLPDAGSGANPDIDKIISLSPDLVLTQTPLSTKDVFRMERAGIRTLVIPACSSLGGLKDVYRALGLVFAGMFTGEEAGEEAFSVVSKACDNKEVVNIGKFVYITVDLKAATGDTLEDSVFSCFGENTAKSGVEYEFDLSALSENHPDIILLNDRYTVDDILSSEYFEGLEPVIAGRVIYIDNSCFERPSARLAELIERMIADYRAL